MESPLVRVISAIFGGYLLILLFLSLHAWVAREYPRRPPEPSNPPRIRHPVHHRQAVNAVKRFARLPESAQTALKTSLASSLMSMPQWHAHLEATPFQLLCMGELHRESTRRFLAEEFFAAISVDVLLLEATPHQLNRLIKRMDAGRDYYPLLDADMMAVLRTATRRNPQISICGIEETAEQATDRLDQDNSRDRSIAENVWSAFEPGRRHVILFGALHCTTDVNWLFDNLLRDASPALQAAMRNVRVLGEHQHGPLEAFVSFLDGIALQPEDFVIPDTRTLHPLIDDWFPLLDQQILQKYQTIVVFRQ